MSIKNYIPGLAFALVSSIISLSSSQLYAESMWMSDGSTVEFEDTIKLDGVLTPDNTLGSQSYEGAVDQNVFFGTYQLPVNASEYVSVEAEWAVLLPADFSGVADETTEVILQGMIDTKYFAQFLQNQLLWLPASVGNNLIASGPGINTTLGALQRGEVEAQIKLDYQDKYFRTQKFNSNSLSISGLPVVDLVNGALAIDSQISVINFGAIEESSAFVNSEDIKALAISKSIIELPLSGLPLTVDSIKQLTLKNISRHVKYLGKYMVSDATIEVLDSNGEVIGEGHLFF